MTFHVSGRELRNWLRGLDSEIRKYLVTVSDPARVMSLYAFDKKMSARELSNSKVAIVSGSMSEPELYFLDVSLENITTLNYEDDPSVYDLTLDWSASSYADLHGAFDVVLCEQVLEHLPDTFQAMQNLSLLLKPNGILHVSVPALNNSHGEPHYYFAGFHPRAIHQLAEKSGLEVHEAQGWASNKAARMYATCDWSPLAQSGSIAFLLMGIVLLARQPKRLARTLQGKLNNSAGHPFQSLMQRVQSKNLVITWMFATKTED